MYPSCIWRPASATTRPNCSNRAPTSSGTNTRAMRRAPRSTVTMRMLVALRFTLVGSARGSSAGNRPTGPVPFPAVADCTHLDQVDPDVQPATDGCEECLRRGGSWVHLRLCMVCGHVGCCDNSPGRH